MNPSLRSFAIECTVAVLLAACATTPQSERAGQEPAPKLGMGPPVELLAIKTIRDKVKAIAAPDGTVHVLIAATETRQVVEAVVLLNDVVQRRIVRSDVSPWRVDSAFDRQGRLHALIDSLHMVLEDGVWRESQQTPWQASGLTVSKPGFVRGGSNLIWIFQVDGSELNAPGRWEIFGMGGYGGAIVLPWFTRGLRTVVVAESAAGYGPWVVVEPTGKEDTEQVDVAADGDGNVHLLYVTSRSGLADASSNCYVKIAAEVLLGEQGKGDRVSEVQTNLGSVLGVVGTAVEKGYLVRGVTSGGPIWVPYPSSGPGAASRWITQSSAKADSPLHGLSIGQARDQWWGKDAPIRYYAYLDNSWSSPVEVGLANVSSFWGMSRDAIDIVATQRGAAFVIWPMEQAIVGRWLEPLR